MEALVTLLAEFLSAPILVLAVLGVELAVVLALLLVDLLSWLVRPSSPPGRGGAAPSRRGIAVLRPIRNAALAMLGLTVGGLVLIHVVLLEPALRLALAIIGQRTGTEIAFASATGNVFTGRVVFTDLTARRQSETRSSFDLKAGVLRADLDLATLVRRPIAFEALEAETVTGTLQLPERRKRQEGEADEQKIRARRTFLAHALTLRDVDVALSRKGREPVAVTLTSVSSAPFRSNYALFDTLFRSSLAGRIDGREIAVTTEALGAERITRWNMPELAALSVSRLITRPPLSWLSEGALDIRVEDRWRPESRAAVDMDWTVRMKGVRTERPEGAGMMQRALVAPITGYIAARGGNVDLSFRLVMNESHFENMASLDTRDLRDILTKSLTKTITEGTRAEADGGPRP